MIVSVKIHSHNPFLRIQCLVTKIGSKRSDSPISRFCFCGENVGRSFVVCSHDPFFKTNKESSIWCQNDHTKFVGTFHLSRRVSDENRACSISICFSKLWIRVMEGHFQCVHMIHFSEATKIGSLKMDRVNRP